MVLVSGNAVSYILLILLAGQPFDLDRDSRECMLLCPMLEFLEAISFIHEGSAMVFLHGGAPNMTEVFILPRFTCAISCPLLGYDEA